MLTVKTAFSPTLIGETTVTLISVDILLTANSFEADLLPLYLLSPVNVATTVIVESSTGV